MPRPARPGFTLLEMMAVLAVILVIGAVVVPTINGLYGNSRQKGAADLIRARLADARALAMEDGKPYRVCVHQDGTRVRIGPDAADFGTQQIEENAGTALAKFKEDKFDTATTAGLQADPDVVAPPPDPSGWVTIATYTPDGTCRETNTVVEIKEGKFPPLLIQIRGVTGGSRIMPQTPAGGTK